MNYTVKLVPENGMASYGDVFEVLKKNGVEADEIKGLYKVGAYTLIQRADGHKAERNEKCTFWPDQFHCNQYG